MNRARRIRNEKLREYQYREEYDRFPEGERVEWDKENNVENFWEQIKPAIIESAREVYESVRVRGENPKSVMQL